MLLSQLFILSIFMFIHQVIISATNIHENIAISCGASGNSPAPDGQVWVGDASFSSSLLQLRGKSIKSRVPHPAGMDPVPYKSARMSRHEFTYQFSVKPGQKFIRLHFKPASYKGFKKSKAIFTVKTDQHTLLSDFIPTLAADALGINYFKKEFCINVHESEALSITFVPSRNPSFLEDTYAFINAIEFVPMPAGPYFTPDGDQGVRVVGQKHRFYIDNTTALETIQRVNVGGNSISSLEDATMFRDWEDDSTYLIEVGAFSINRAIAIRYSSSATHIAPKEVYQTARSVGAYCHSNVCNLTWNIPLDLGFRYLVRLHFCEIEQDERLTEKSYVYSFGLVLFEMLCANEALDQWQDQGQVSLAQWIKTCSMTLTSNYIHPCLVGRISPDCFELFGNTAINCLHDKGNKRPSMSDIITSLKEALKLQEAAKIT